MAHVFTATQKIKQLSRMHAKAAYDCARESFDRNRLEERLVRAALRELAEAVIGWSPDHCADYRKLSLHWSTATRSGSVPGV